MNKAAINHIPKSPMAYAFDSEHLHIFLQVGIGDAVKVELIAGDPFEYKVIDGVYVWNGRANPLLPMEKTYDDGLHDFWFISLHAESRRRKYAFLIHGKDETYFYGCRQLLAVTKETNPDSLYVLFDYFNFPYINDEDLISSPKWTENTVWYQIFPERFHRSEKVPGHFLPWGSIEAGITNHNFFGGNLPGIIEKLPYLNDLGITGIYFTPIFEATSTHKYDTIDYLTIDHQFGTNEDFKKLVDGCHKLGIKVLLDAVFNHCGWFHPFFQDVIKNKKKSKYWDCFYIEDENFIDFEIDKNNRPVIDFSHHYKFRTFATTPMMPKWNVANPLVEEYLLKVATYWITEYHIDGWRLDVSDEVSHSFWRKFQKAVRHANPDIYIVGENWDDANAWLRGDQFDAVMNYRLAYSLWNFLEEKPGKSSALEFTHAISSLLVRYQKNVNSHMFNLVDSHDTPRIITRLDKNKQLVKMAYLFIFSFGGSPAIFYGDEIGLEGKHDPDCRRCMIWDEKRQDRELLAFFKQLIILRKTYEDFQKVDLHWLIAEDNVVAYQKGQLVFILNDNPSAKQIKLSGKFLDLITKAKVSAKELAVEAFGYRILEKQE